MNKFKEKRNSLEKFIKEQNIGPGAYNKKYFFLNNWDESELFGKDLSEMEALNNFTEVIPELPAYQYSSAILFPVTKQVVSVGNQQNQEVGDLEEVMEDDEEPTNTSADDDKTIDDNDSSIILKQQNYPNTFGLTFVFDKNKNSIEDFNVSVSFRKYQLISIKNIIDRQIAINITEYKKEIKEAINEYFIDVFGIEEKESNLFVFPKTKFNQQTVYNIDYGLLNNYLKNTILIELHKVFSTNNIEELNESNGIKFFGIKTLFIQFYSISNEKYGYSEVYTLFDNSIINFIKKELEKDISNYAEYKNLIKHLEIYNQLRNITTNLKTIVKEKNSSPIWESKHYTKEIKLPLLDPSKNIERKRNLPIDIEDKEIKDLLYSVQYITKKDNISQQEKVYVKLIIVNNSVIELAQNEPPQLNKKNEANKKAFFGVELEIRELKQNSLLKYNPPQLLDFDEEDSFNKLIYRNYVDFGEGYNTSVTWGSRDNNLNYISTDFLPAQETPKVDYKPSKIVDNKVVSRLTEDKVLSMRFLSTLNNVNDKEIINQLNIFIDAYGHENGSSWINDKQRELDNERINENEKGLLNKQLKACRRDYKRLKRNICILENNVEALAAFRTLNTAMFMQLHHNLSKKDNIPFIPEGENLENYYETVKIFDKNNNEIEYKWRSFQLAFILLNIDAFVKPNADDKTVKDVFGTGWPERNEIADLVWFPTGGGKTEAYLGIIAFAISYRRFTKKAKGYGTTVLMRYTLRMLTLQQFQRATMLIFALEVMRKETFVLPNNLNLGQERITIGLFVGGDSLPNYWNQGDKSMINELEKISNFIKDGKPISTNLPFTDCPWCGGELFIDAKLPNVCPNHTNENNKYNFKKGEMFAIACNTKNCTFHSEYASNKDSLPFRLFDEDIYCFPPTLLFGTVDKFAAFANNLSTEAGIRNKDSRRLVGKGYNFDVLPPELIIQDELHLLLGPLGSAVGLFEKSIDYLCTYTDEKGNVIKPKIVTSTATTRNTDNQIFALFNRRSEIFPKQGIFCDDSFFSFYERKSDNTTEYNSLRKYVGVLPVGKTQVWMQLRIISICLSHRIKYFKEKYTNDIVFESPESLKEFSKVFDYYHTILSYYNSLKDVGKAQSQLNHYLPGDVNYVIENTTPWSFLDKILRNESEINFSELTGRLTGEEVKTNLSNIEKEWSLFEEYKRLKSVTTPEFIIATNMISVGIDVSRFNTIVMNSMPRNIAEYIQASSRVARDEDGIVLTVHHPFRSRDISHYQKFKEFHEKFYSYVEPISVTPFASKALDRYLAMYVTVLIRHNEDLGLTNNDSASSLNINKIELIKNLIKVEIEEIYNNSHKLEKYLNERKEGIKSSVDGIISEEELNDLIQKLDNLLKIWFDKLDGTDSIPELEFRNQTILKSLFTSAIDNNTDHWKISYSLREIGATTVIKTVQQ